MTIQNLINNTIDMQGNCVRGNQVYISSQNMVCFAGKLEEIDTKQGILITPYLIVENGGLYELHYYEFDVEVRGDESYYVDYNLQNTLPTEITKNLKPQVIIAVGDRDSYSKAVKWYLTNMSKMKFKEDKEHYTQLQNAKLFYQIFTDDNLS